MAFLRTIEILKEINLLFEEHDFELRSNRKLRKVNLYKLQPVFNINGTVTVVASHSNKAATYLTFSGNGAVELWPYGEVFHIDHETQEPTEIRKQFRSILEKEYHFDFKNGGHSAIPRWNHTHMLLHPRIIPQIFQVFQNADFDLKMWNCNIPTEITCSDRLNAAPLPDGRIIITIGVENLESEYSYAGKVFVLFDGSNTVNIGDREHMRCEADMNDPEKLKTVAIEDTRRVLVEQYGVSFQKHWHMNTPPTLDPYGMPYDRSGFQIAYCHEDLVYGPYLFRRQLLDSELDYLVTNEERERLLAICNKEFDL